MQKKMRSTNIFFVISMLFAGLVISPAVLAEEYTFTHGFSTITVDLDYNNNVMTVKFKNSKYCPKGETLKTAIPAFGKKTKKLDFKCGASVTVVMDANQQGVDHIEFTGKGWTKPKNLTPKVKPKALVFEEATIVSVW